MDIFVGSLPFKMKEIAVRELFEKFGEVESVKFIIDKITRQAKGFGFVVMPNNAEGSKAIKALNGLEIMGRTIIVSQSEDKKQKDKKRGGFGKGGTNFRGNFGEKPFFKSDTKKTGFIKKADAGKGRIRTTTKRGK